MQNNSRNVMRPEAELYPKHEFTQQVVEGPAVCKRCHAVHQHKRWVFDDALASRLLSQPGMLQVTCPGCHAVQIKKADGVLTMRSPLIKQKGNELENLLRAEEKREMLKNPLSRIIYIDRHADSLEVATTTEFLAKDLGRQLQKAFGGDLDIDKLPREAFTRVRWSREAE